MSVSARRNVIASLAASLLIVACTTRPVRQEPTVEQRFELDFITLGVTTRSEIVERLGEPFFGFDDGRLYTYYLARRQGEAVATNRSECGRANRYGYCRTRHELILAFDEKGIVSRRTFLLANQDP